MQPLNKQEIHQLAMQEVGNFLEENGYEFLAVNSKRNRSPQFVCVKDKLLFFIVKFQLKWVFTTLKANENFMFE